MRTAWIIVVLVTLAACKTTEISATQPDVSVAEPVWKPINVVSERQRIIRANPNARGVAFYNQRGKGIRFLDDNNFEFVAFGARTDLRTRTKITQASGNRVCVARTEDWSGACFDFFGDLDADVKINVEYGNGATHSYTTVMTIE